MKSNSKNLFKTFTQLILNAKSKLTETKVREILQFRKYHLCLDDPRRSAEELMNSISEIRNEANP